MSVIAERAIVFYLTHPGVVDEVEMSHGQVHRVYNCPECTNALVLQDDELVALGNQPGILADDELQVVKVQGAHPNPDQQGEQELVPC